MPYSSLMNAITDVWTQLKQVSLLLFKAESLSETGWKGSGTGLVKVTEPAPDVIIFEEGGQFQQLNGKEMRFTNVFRWSRLDEKIRLEHLRFGAEHPVFLFDMAVGDDGIWHEVVAHACRDDFYKATLQIENDTIYVRWVVEGPTRNEVISYTYM